MAMWGGIQVFQGRVIVERKEEALRTALEWRDWTQRVWTDGSTLEDGRVGAATPGGRRRVDRRRGLPRHEQGSLRCGGLRNPSGGQAFPRAERGRAVLHELR